LTTKQQHEQNSTYGKESKQGLDFGALNVLDIIVAPTVLVILQNPTIHSPEPKDPFGHQSLELLLATRRNDLPMYMQP